MGGLTKNVETNIHSDRNLLGISLMLGFCFIAPILDVFAKLAAQQIPIAQITMVRFSGQTFFMLIIILVLRNSITIPFFLFLPLVSRAAYLIIATFCFFSAIKTMPIADAVAIVFIEPFILLLIGKFIFKETVGIRRTTACIVGFIGVILVIKPSFANFGIIALYPLGTAFCFAFYMISTRRISQYLDPIRMQFYTAFLGTIVCVPIFIFGEFADISTLKTVIPPNMTWLWLFGVALFGTISHLFISYALKFASSTVLAPLHYLEIISAVFFGFLVFGDVPDLTALYGMLIIISSGIYIFFREKSLQKNV